MKIIIIVFCLLISHGTISQNKKRKKDYVEYFVTQTGDTIFGKKLKLVGKELLEGRPKKIIYTDLEGNKKEMAFDYSKNFKRNESIMAIGRVESSVRSTTTNSPLGIAHYELLPTKSKDKQIKLRKRNIKVPHRYMERIISGKIKIYEWEHSQTKMVKRFFKIGDEFQHQFHDINKLNLFLNKCTAYKEKYENMKALDFDLIIDYNNICKD